MNTPTVNITPTIVPPSEAKAFKSTKFSFSNRSCKIIISIAIAILCTIGAIIYSIRKRPQSGQVDEEKSSRKTTSETTPKHPHVERKKGTVEADHQTKSKAKKAKGAVTPALQSIPEAQAPKERAIQPPTFRYATPFEVNEITDRNTIISLIGEWNVALKEKKSNFMKDFYLTHGYPKNYKDLPVFTKLYSTDTTLPPFLYFKDRDILTPFANTSDSYQNSPEIKFKDLEWILQFLEKEIDYGYTTIVSRANGKVQAIAYFSEQDQELKHIATHPDNIKLPINKECRVAGAATSIIVYLAKKTSSSGKDFKLYSVPNACKFYEHLHFEKQEDPTKERLYVLSADKVNELVKSKTPPFN